MSRIVADDLLGQLASLCEFLSVHQMEWEAIRILDSNFVSSSRNVDEFLYVDTELLCRGIKVFTSFGLETTATKFRLLGFLGDVNVLIGAVTAEVDSIVIFLSDMHTKIEEEFLCLCKIWVAISL